MTACIRSSIFGEEMVSCEDMSRDGLGFKSPNRYPVGQTIEVATPYEPGAVSIFVPARIANARELRSEGLVRYGVEYIRHEFPF